MEAAQTRDWMTQEEATAFIGDNAPFYLEKWKLHYETALKGWNWAAMFFGVEWMAYRKMYLEAALSIIMIYILSVPAVLLGLNEDLWSLCLRALFGVFGNMLYRHKAMRVLRKLNSPSDSERLAALSRRGGVCIPAVVVLIVSEILLGVLLGLLVVLLV